MITNYRVNLTYASRNLTLAEAEEPIGLDDIEFKMVRHPEWHGVFPEISSKLKFFGSGYDFLMAAYRENGIDASVRCVIEAYDQNWETVYDGLIDFTDASFTERFMEVDVRANNCLELFLKRQNIPVNLYEEPCFTELTMDGTAYRTRYRYAPYLLTMPEVTMTGITEFDVSNETQTRWVEFKNFGLFTFRVCDGSSIAMSCGYVSPCFVSNFALYIPIPFSSTKDDLELLGGGVYPADEVQALFDDSNNNTSFSPWSLDGQRTGTTRRCKCHEYNIELSGSFKWKLKAELKDGFLYYVRVRPVMRLEIGRIVNGSLQGYAVDVYTGTYFEYDNGCIPWGIPYPNIFDINSFQTVNFAHTASIPCGVIESNDIFGIFIRFELDIFTGFADDGIKVGVEVEWLDGGFTATSSTCMEPDPIGETETYAYLIHEAFSRIVEHTTNNCLRVKSNYFGRPNSLEWGDDLAVQNPKDSYGCYPITNACDLLNPQGFPICASTFNLAPYQTVGYGCGSATAITYGLSLRQRGTECFLSFEELFAAANAVWGIGMGWTEADRDNVYIENWEYFYNDVVILELDGADLYNAKVRTTVATDFYFNKFVFGYSSWLEEEYNTKDVIHATREYSILIKNAKETFGEACEFVADGYAIEYQRRQERYSDTGKFDDTKFFVCVGKSDDRNNTITYNNGGVVTRPSHLFIAEQGVANSIGINDDILNYRIAPSNIIDRRLQWISIPLWVRTALGPQFGAINFAKGEANFKAFGNNLPNHIACETSKQPAENNAQQAVCAKLFPEITEIEYPLRTIQYKMLRANPYGIINVNGVGYYLLDLSFRPTGNSKLKLIRRRECNIIF